MDYFQLIIEILLLLGVLYLVFFKSYFSEKGKNLATQEDIGKITNTVEQIKNDLHFSTQSKLSIKTEERTALVDVYTRFNLYLKKIMNASFSGATHDNPGKLDLIDEDIRDSRLQFEMAKVKTGLFVKNDDLTKVLGELDLQALELQHVVESALDQLKLIFSQTRLMLLNTPLQQQPGEFQKFLDKQSELYHGVRAEKIKRYKPIAQLEHELRQICYAHIQKLMDGD